MTEEYRDVSFPQARQIVEQAKENESVIALDRIGASPFLKYTPYTNNSGVTVHMWSCISYTFTRKPDKTLLSTPKIIDPSDHDSWEINMITTEWVINHVTKSRIVKVKEKENSPFAGDIVGGWNE
jgi:hypothetical protein